MSDKAYATNRRPTDRRMLARRALDRRASDPARGGPGGPSMSGQGAPAMNDTRTPRRTPAREPGWLLRIAGVLLAGGLLAGCSDAWTTFSRPLDPLPPADPQDIQAPQQGAGEYPSLSSVPDAPPRRPSGREERQAIRESLSADRANARYSDQRQTGEGIEARQGRQGGGGQAASAPAGGEQTATVSPDIPDRPEVAERMPADDAGTSTQARRSQPSGGSGAQASGSDTPARAQQSGNTGQMDGGSETSGTDAADVPQLEQSQQGEPIDIPAQPSFGGNGRSGAPDTGQSSRAQQQSASRESDGAIAAPGPSVGQSRTLSRQDAGGQPTAGGSRRVAVIYFGHGSAKLQDRDRQVLRKVARIHERQGRDLRVVGHASKRTAAMDPVDHRMANFNASLSRAQAVVDALVSMGVPREAIQLEARGDNDPVYHEFMPTGEAGNRRAEIFLQG
ncbi:hypothetical protein CKO28_11955 [Rhodovibrio sodomensis]|uniref:OmpA-like domain-containing protein n=1 Tax=Rhodovibrio sodomensis TaxID=1088 RepID=A0ABS1DE57_9PROT|nr:OmpA family protein [Rhodovibrio sodomensis]MBK1668743.1 hypothetical protein [Rhodovibrio sodomensis]